MVEASDQQLAAHPGLSSADSTAVTRDQARAVFGQVMGFVTEREHHLFGGDNE
jgi:hypothetical protein